ncbi:hypothetical protein Tco_0270964 [Tanacetum coccineum]
MHVSWRGSHTWIVVAAMAGTWLQPWRVFGIASIFLALFELTFLYGCVMVGAMLLILIIRGRDEFNQVRVDHMARYVKVAAALFPVSGVVLVVELLMLLMTAMVICLITDDVTADLRRTVLYLIDLSESHLNLQEHSENKTSLLQQLVQVFPFKKVIDVSQTSSYSATKSIHIVSGANSRPTVKISILTHILNNFLHIFLCRH